MFSFPVLNLKGSLYRNLGKGICISLALFLYLIIDGVDFQKAAAEALLVGAAAAVLFIPLDILLFDKLMSK